MSRPKVRPAWWPEDAVEWTLLALLALVWIGVFFRGVSCVVHIDSKPSQQESR